MCRTLVQTRIASITTVVSAVALLLGLGACSSAPEGDSSASSTVCDQLFAARGEPDGTRVVVAADQTASSGAVALSGVAREAIAAASDSRGSVSVLAIDGAGASVTWAGLELPLNDPELAIDTKRHTRITEVAPNCVAGLVAASGPTTAGSDILTAMQLGAQMLDGNGVFILMTDGMSNSGVLDFAVQPYDTPPADIVSALDSIGQIPRFEGVDVIITGIGGTRGVPLNQVVVEQFLAIYVAICEASGAASCIVEAAVPAESVARAGLPEDVALSLPAVEPPVIDNGVCVYTLSGGVAFGGESFVLTDAAQAIVAAFASHIGSTQVDILVQGHTATGGDPARSQQLSEDRAEAVYNALLGSGIDPSHLTWEGKGGTEPRYADHDANGEKIGDAIAANRRVELEVSGSACD
jgi:outer membrane protein OmpA-like peptidoglycan-associated protein